MIPRLEESRLAMASWSPSGFPAKAPGEKRWVTDEQMSCLIAAGAKVYKDAETLGGVHVKEAVYKDITFISVKSSIPPIPLFPVHPTTQ